MTVLLVIVMFIGFVLLDMVVQRRRDAQLLHAGESLQRALDREGPRWVAGIRLPESLFYHQGHLWVHPVSRDMAYVGVDDFGRRLLGRDAKLELPSRGTIVRQGAPCCHVSRNGERVALASPIGGEVVGVNPAMKGDSSLAHDDPYARGWVYKIRSVDLRPELANLLNGSLAARWMEDSCERFRRFMTNLRGSVVHDGGLPVEDVAAALGEEEWREAVRAFLAPCDRTPVEGR